MCSFDTHFSWWYQWVPIKILLKFVPKGPINNILELVQIMAWCWSGGKPLSEPVMVSLLMHVCITRPDELIKPVVKFMQHIISVFESVFLYFEVLVASDFKIWVSPMIVLSKMLAF